MGIRSKWRAGHMKDPVSGVFRVSDWYDAHPHSSPPDTRLTGVIIADGLPPTPAEAPVDHRGKWAGRDELPVTVDRADPSNFRIEWDQVVTPDWQATARQRAFDEATKLAGGEAAIGMPPAGPAGQFGSAGPLGDRFAATVEQALRSAGMDPGILRSPNTTVHVESSFGAMTPDQVRGMTSAFAGVAGATVPATGVVRAVHDVAPQGVLPQGMSQADVTLDVSRPDGSTYPATTRIGFSTPARRAAVATVGTTLPLLVNPNDPGRVVIDVGRLNLP